MKVKIISNFRNQIRKEMKQVFVFPYEITGRTILMPIVLLMLLLTGFMAKDFNKQAAGETTAMPLKRPLKRVLILGNSITIHSPKPSIGWYGNWGMAASAENKDFVHLLIERLNQIDPAIQVDVKNIADYERNYRNYDYALLDSLADLKPDLVILRLSENVDPLKAKENDFELHFGKLMDYLMARSPGTHLLTAASFWDRPVVTQAMYAASHIRKGQFINLGKLSESPGNMAIGQFENKGVAMHPSDQGMMAITEAIWQEILKIYPDFQVRK
ncbi:hypothetical protein ACSBL2_19000 [Pedobacter sp. AW31-3R]|uniref:hypothetical protein n=1 Tax=Pedobacter sp. AW31-3R TaxID=3445781 RepID=UPI003F9F43AD